MRVFGKQLVLNKYVWVDLEVILSFSLNLGSSTNKQFSNYSFIENLIPLLPVLSSLGFNLWQEGSLLHWFICELSFFFYWELTIYALGPNVPPPPALDNYSPRDKATLLVKPLCLWQRILFYPGWERPTSSSLGNWATCHWRRNST